MNFHNRSDEELVAEIESLKSDGLALFGQICERLTELDQRKYKHPLHQHKQFRHHKAVTSGKLIPAIVVMFDGSKPHLNCFYGRPEDVQRTVAAGREFDVVQISKGEVKERRINVAKMSLKVIQNLFPAGKSPRSLSEQRVVLEEELSKRPETHRNGKPLVRAVPGEDSLTVGGVVIPVSVFRQALAELGYCLTEKEDA